MEGLVYLALIVGGLIGYQKLLVYGVRPRKIRTNLATDQVRRLFADKVAVVGWKVVDDDDPMIAESAAWAGIQQQIGLWVKDEGTLREATVGVVRYSKRVLGGITKAHTLRIRINAFIRALQQADPTAVVQEATQ